jgi:multicomponent K+:H+ antiporter subunit D
MMAASHWIIVPVVLPLIAGALLLAIERIRPAWVRGTSIAAVAASFAVCIALLLRASDGNIESYLVGNWQAPFGIVLVLDRLSAMMIVLTGFVGFAAVLYASAAEDRIGVHFHALFQFQLMGINGAFLTGDLFNLFVFFEVLLISSYALLLHGGGARRARAGVHYVSFNLAGSALFLIAVSLLYAATGTLNMADLANRVASLTGIHATLAKTAGMLLLVVFCVKAALLPLYFWLPDTYGAASAPVAALFAIMTKVGIYSIARMYTLVFGEGGGELASLAHPWIPILAMGTILLGAIGAVGANRLRTMIAYLVVGSAGLLLLAVGLGQRETIAAGLFYLVHSTLAVAALFLFANWVMRARGENSDRCIPDPRCSSRMKLGATFFVLAIAVASLPPLGGFLGKALLLQGSVAHAMIGWIWASVLIASFLVVVATARFGIALFWEGGAREPSETQATGSSASVAPTVFHTREVIAVAALVIALFGVARFGGALSEYAKATAQQLVTRTAYIQSVVSARPAPAAYDVRKEMRERGDK